jgi:hypothetical protein
MFLQSSRSHNPEGLVYIYIYIYIYICKGEGQDSSGHCTATSKVCCAYSKGPNLNTRLNEILGFHDGGNLGCDIACYGTA